MSGNTLLWIALGSGIAALAFAWWKTRWVNQQDPGTERMQEIGAAVSEGAMAFLNREYRVLTVVVILVAILLALINQGAIRLVAVAFAFGAFCSALSGFFGMKVATAANMRTTNAARKGLPEALQVAFSGGTVMGMSVVGLGLAGLTLTTGVLMSKYGTDIEIVRSVIMPIVTGFSMGASSIALFARVGGGIYTKAADVGADLVGKVEAGIPEDDPRNPAVIADNVGDNVGDVAGMGADLFESYVGAIVAAMVLGATITVGGLHDLRFVLLPLVIAGAGILLSIVGTFFVKTKEGGNPQAALNQGTFGACIIMAIATYFICKKLLPAEFNIESAAVGVGMLTRSSNGVFLATVVGLAAGAFIGMLAEYYTAEGRGPSNSVAAASETGAATNIIAGLGVGMLGGAHAVRPPLARGRTSRGVRHEPRRHRLVVGDHLSLGRAGGGVHHLVEVRHLDRAVVDDDLGLLLRSHHASCPSWVWYPETSHLTAAAFVPRSHVLLAARIAARSRPPCSRPTSADSSAHTRRPRRLTRTLRCPVRCSIAPGTARRSPTTGTGSTWADPIGARASTETCQPRDRPSRRQCSSPMSARTGDVTCWPGSPRSSGRRS